MSSIDGLDVSLDCLKKYGTVPESMTREEFRTRVIARDVCPECKGYGRIKQTNGYTWWCCDRCRATGWVILSETEQSQP